VGQKGRREVFDRAWAIEVLGLVALATSFYAIPWVPLYAIAFAGLAVLTWRRLDSALALVVLFAPLFMYPKHIGHYEFAPSEILLLLDAAVLLGWMQWSKKWPQLDWHALRRSPYLFPGSLFLGAGAVSTLFAADQHVALRAYRETILEPAGFFAMLTIVRSPRREWYLRYGALLGAGMVVGLFGLGTWVTGRDLAAASVGSGIKLVKSVYGSPDNVGLLFDRVIPVWFAALLLLVRNRWRMAAFSVCGVVFVATLLLSRSRGAEVAVVLGVLLVVALWHRRSVWLIAAIAVIGLGGLAVKAHSIENALNAGHAGTAQNRVYIWETSLKMIRDHPVLGVGPDNFLHYYAPVAGPRRYAPCPAGLGYVSKVSQALASNEPCQSHPHNVILDLYLSTGIAGLIAFLWLEAMFGWQAVTVLRRLWRASSHPAPSASASFTSRLLVGVFPWTFDWRWPFVVGSMGAMMAALVHGMVDNSYFLVDLSLIFWLLLAGAQAMAQNPATAGRTT
jgi:O-antigen ligase